LSGLADEPDLLSEAIVLTTHSDPRARARMIYFPSY
jgi:hypothetical protein